MHWRFVLDGRRPCTGSRPFRFLRTWRSTSSSSSPTRFPHTVSVRTRRVRRLTAGSLPARRWRRRSAPRQPRRAEGPLRRAPGRASRGGLSPGLAAGLAGQVLGDDRANYCAHASGSLVPLLICGESEKLAVQLRRHGDAEPPVSPQPLRSAHSFLLQPRSYHDLITSCNRLRVRLQTEKLTTHAGEETP